MERTPKQIVMTFLQALNGEKFEKARTLLSDRLRFRGVLGNRDGGDAYIDDMRKMKLKYQVLKAFGDDHEVSVFYNIDMNGKVIFTAGWYKLMHGKIASIKVLFDPRPLLEEKEKL